MTLYTFMHPRSLGAGLLERSFCDRRWYGWHGALRRIAVRMTVTGEVWQEGCLLMSGYKAAHQPTHVWKCSNLKFEHEMLTCS
jgi:hypothetical protein